jgi:hypothetical protein
MFTLNRTLVNTGLLSASMILSNIAFSLEGVSSNTANGTAKININEIDGILIGFSHPQTLSVSSPNNEVNRAASGVINSTWHVASNNAVEVKFTGKSPDAGGTVVNAPTFYKAEVSADGEQIGTQYDHLTTTFGATINNMEPGQGTLTGEATWGGGAIPNIAAVGTAGIPTRPEELNGTRGADSLEGTPEELISTAGGNFGIIMPDDNGIFSLTLSSRGVGDASTTQSGDYQVTIVASFVASEIGNITVIPESATTGSLDGGLGFLTDALTYNDLAGVDAVNAKNTRWTANKSDVNSYGVQSIKNKDGIKVSVSAQKISDDANDTTATNANYYNEQQLP